MRRALCCGGTPQNNGNERNTLATVDFFKAFNVMKKLNCFLSFILFFLVSNIYSQNLVPNPSFETITQCPVVESRIYYAPPWFQPSTWHGNVINSCTSDLFDTCGASITSQGIPQNINGYQYARTGIGYAGIIPYNDTLNAIEYLEVPLLDTLITNHTYCAEYYVSLANPYGEAISNMGAYFSVDSLLDATYLHAINYVTPQIENPLSNMLSDTLNWMLVSGSFIANGGEKFMTIGNFHLPATTHTVYINGGYNESYYYIDDVSVVDCGSVGIPEKTQTNYNVKLYPNPNNGNFAFEYHLEGNDAEIISIYDITGKLIRKLNFNSTNTSTSINASELDAGIYLYDVLINNTKVKTDKLIIIK